MDNELFKVITLQEAAKLWNKDDSTLRRVINGPNFKNNIDYRKTGKVWLIRKDAMERVYGPPKEKGIQNSSGLEQIKKYLGNVIGVTKSFHVLSDQDLKFSFIETLEYIRQFKLDNDFLDIKDIKDHKEIKECIKSNRALQSELEKRNIGYVDIEDPVDNEVVRRVKLKQFDIERLVYLTEEKKVKEFHAPCIAKEGLDFIYNRITNENIALVGGPGVGKTVLAKLLTERFVEENEKVLIINDAAHYRELYEYADIIEYLGGENGEIENYHISDDLNSIKVNEKIFTKKIIQINIMDSYSEKTDAVILDIINLASKNGVKRIIFENIKVQFFLKNIDELAFKCKNVRMIALLNDCLGNKIINQSGKTDGELVFKDIFSNIMLFNGVIGLLESYADHYGIEVIDYMKNIQSGSGVFHKRCNEGTVLVTIEDKYYKYVKRPT